MDKQTTNLILSWAKQYNTKDFIKNDPIQFPHRFTDNKDIEISGFLTAWISYGNRSVILKKANYLHDIMENKPYHFITKQKYTSFKNNNNSFYRFYKYSDFYLICNKLYEIYANAESIESYIHLLDSNIPIISLEKVFTGLPGIPCINSACKRLNMFLRWMIRQDKIVDFGIWNQYSPANLIIPLDTHVFQTAHKINLTDRKTVNMITAKDITNSLKDIFPEDPCLGDFALFGYGIHK